MVYVSWNGYDFVSLTPIVLCNISCVCACLYARAPAWRSQYPHALEFLSSISMTTNACSDRSPCYCVAERQNPETARKKSQKRKSTTLAVTDNQENHDVANWLWIRPQSSVRCFCSGQGCCWAAGPFHPRKSEQDGDGAACCFFSDPRLDRSVESIGCGCWDDGRRCSSLSLLVVTAHVSTN